MAEWWLSFSGFGRDCTLTTEHLLREVTRLFGAPAVGYGAWEDHDEYSFRPGRARSGWLTIAEPCDLHITFSEDSTRPFLMAATIRVRSDRFEQKREIWTAFQAMFATYGLVDETLEKGMAAIVDDADNAGESAYARELRREITRVWCKLCAHQTSVDLYRTRPDDHDAIVAAPVSPELTSMVRLIDTQLAALPRNLTRFANLTTLWIEEQPYDGHDLAGVRFPKVHTLYLGKSRIVALSRDQLAGFPALRLLRVHDCALDDLDLGIVDVCPDLERVWIGNTPLSLDEHRMAALAKRFRPAKLRPC